MVRPSALAVLRLRTNSKRTGCSTGKSAGFAPLRILPTSAAARRYSIGHARPIGHETTRLCKVPSPKNRWEAALERQRRDPSFVRSKEGSWQQEERASALSGCGVECALELVRTSHLHELQLHPQRRGRCLHLCQIECQATGSDEDGHTGDSWNRLLQQLQQLPV